jgi:basic amino acid/polyamine antiporter, APA family
VRQSGFVPHILSPVTDSAARLPRALGLWSAALIVIGVTVGSGIFRSPAGIAARVPDASAVIGLWILGGAIALCGALSVAELAVALPETGGLYVYLREGWGRLAGFLFGWAQLVAIRASSLGGIAIAFGEYTLRAGGEDPTAHPIAARAIAIGALAIAAAANILGVRLGAAVVSASSIAKFAALVIIVAAAFLLGGSHGASAAHLTSAAGPVTVSGLGLALVGVLWAYDGFADLSYAAGEVKHPDRNLPRAIILGTAAVVGIYILANVAYLYVNPVDVMGRSPLVAADTMSAIFGAPGAGLVSVFVMISTFGALNAITLSSPRIFFALADDGLFFRPIAAVHPRYRTPYVAILLTTGLGMALAASRSFEALTSQFVLAVWPFYALAVAAIYRLRKTRPELPRPYRVLGYPFVPAIFIAAVVWFVVNSLVNDTVATATTFAIILAGVPIYFVVFGRRRSER